MSVRMRGSTVRRTFPCSHRPGTRLSPDCRSTPDTACLLSVLHNSCIQILRNHTPADRRSSGSLPPGTEALQSVYSAFSDLKTRYPGRDSRSSAASAAVRIPPKVPRLSSRHTGVPDFRPYCRDESGKPPCSVSSIFCFRPADTKARCRSRPPHCFRLSGLLLRYTEHRSA